MSTEYVQPRLPESAPFSVTIVPCLKDNYSYIIYDKKSQQVAVVDPVEPDKVLSALESKLGLKPAAIKYVLTTHYHWDHAGGNDKLAGILAKEGSGEHVVVGGADDKIPACSLQVTHGQEIKFGGLTIRAIHTPCHTRGHTCYYIAPNEDAEVKAEDFATAVFSGDTLFAGGCGRLFEGTAAEMHENLTKKLGTLPESTLVYAGHEYTKSNLAFGLAAAEPDNAILKAKLDWVSSLPAGTPSLPSSIRDELATNVFMRASSVERFADLRKQKDSW